MKITLLALEVAVVSLVAGFSIYHKNNDFAKAYNSSSMDYSISKYSKHVQICNNEVILRI